MKSRGHILLTIALLMTLPLAAIERNAREYLPHDLRIGWGDMLFETAIWHTNSSTNHYRYTGHIFAEYQYHFRPWLSFGAQLDYEQVWWDVTKIGILPLNNPSQNHHFYNISILPTLRFTYFHHPYLNLYSSFFVGLTINGGTEIDMYGRHTACAPAWGLTLLGLKTGNDHIYAAIEIGALNALLDKNFIYMFGSRLFSASIGCNF